ncbi:MAG: hypothetical protein CMI16_08650 [Opitutaceae bacterium]|nr:hypothetical protein [Opitutaceae bacterium]
MSLNRTEQMTFDYLEENHDEYRFWKEKVVSVAKAVNSDHEAARRLEEELWAYVVERSAVVNPFRDVAQSEGLPRTSMRNLAEYILRLWTVPRKKPKKALS